MTVQTGRGSRNGVPAGRRYRLGGAGSLVTASLAGGLIVTDAEPGGEIVAHSGGQFTRSLIRLGLVDEYRCWCCPPLQVRVSRCSPTLTTR
jgi:hypothetical protein